MIGTFVNASLILLGSFIGSFLRKGLKERYQQALYTAMGLSAFGLGITNVVENMGKSNYHVLFIFSLAIGSIIGTKLDLETRFERVTSHFASSELGEGLSTAIVLFCIGSLSILGPIQSALYQDHTYLFTNATLDFVTSMVLASTYGIGIALAAGVLFLWQGGIYLGAQFLTVFLTPDVMVEISLIGGFLIAASGLGILKIKDCKTLNLLPALLVPIIFFLIKNLF